jgi:APA family basic amino acid/polyamine antiporter
MNNQRTLVRVLGLGGVIIVVVANILGSGVYKKVAPMAAELNSPTWILAAWVVAGIITLFGALGNAEIAGMLADTGGEYVYLKKIYNRFVAFLYGWSLFAVIQSATIASIAYVFAQSLNNIIPLPEIFGSVKDYSIAGVFFPFHEFRIKLIAISLIIVLTILNVSGIKTSAGLSKVIMFMVFAGFAVIIAAGLGNTTSNAEQISFSLQNQSGAITLSSFYAAMLAAFWAYQGWVSVGFIGGEVKNPNKNLPKGIIIGVFVVIAVYLAINYTYLSILPVSELVQINDSGHQIAAVEALRNLWGKGGAMFISLLILITTLSCTNVSVLTGSRPYFAMARDRLFFPAFGKINKNSVPGVSILCQGIWSSVLVLSGNFDQLTDMLVFTVFIFYGATALGVFILRYRVPNAHRPYKTWGYPVVPAIFILFCIGLFFNTIFMRPREAAIGLTLMLAGIPVYLFLKRFYSRSEQPNSEISE